jgi:exopolysaccharide biosynthesis predicted pyruvyltransferase EpsI
VLTNRLHAHIPHVVLDDSNGKVGTFRDTWTHPSETARWAGRADAMDDRLAELAS